MTYTVCVVETRTTDSVAYNVRKDAAQVKLTDQFMHVILSPVRQHADDVSCAKAERLDNTTFSNFDIG